MRLVVRDLKAGELGQLLEHWQRVDGGNTTGPSVDQAVDLIGSGGGSVLVAEAEGEIVGAALFSIFGPGAWLHRLSFVPDAAIATEIGDQLLGEMDRRLADGGARAVGTVTRGGRASIDALERWDYRVGEGEYRERAVPPAVSVPSGLAAVSGQIIDPQLWNRLQGLVEAKEIIERRVILPLAEPELAARHAVRPPKAIVLFGPPGTGKTTFAKGIASRLAWPFVEIQPRELAGEGPEQEARLLADTLDGILELGSAVVFVDEVEDLASIRHQERRVSASVTNEFLKQIPRLRDAPTHLLVCATNWVDRLDPAFLRPGRFDYVLPVGPPDAEARRAIWQRYTDEITDGPVDLPALVRASEFYTPADIEFAARKAAQAAFEREHFEQSARRASTDDFLDAVRRTRPSLNRETIDRFDKDTKLFGRY